MKRIVFFLFVACLPLYLFAQSVSVNAEMDSVNIWIGEQTKFTISAIQPNNKVLNFPLFSDSIVDGLEIVEQCKRDTVVLPSGDIKVSDSYVVTAFDSALILVPKLVITDENDSFFTNPVALKVFSVPVDSTQQAIADIKNVVKPPFDWITFLTFTAIVVLVIIIAVLIFFIVRYYRRKKKDKNDAPEVVVDNRPAHVIALEQLETLRQKQLWQKSMFKEYFTELTDILRRYIDNRFGISAMEMPSEDLVDEFKSRKDIESNKELLKLLKSILSLSDLVKFAKWVPLPDENTSAFSDVLKFIDLSKQEEEIIDNKENTTSDDASVTNEDKSNANQESVD